MMPWFNIPVIVNLRQLLKHTELVKNVMKKIKSIRYCGNSTISDHPWFDVPNAPCSSCQTLYKYAKTPWTCAKIYASTSQQKLDVEDDERDKNGTKFQQT